MENIYISPKFSEFSYFFLGVSPLESLMIRKTNCYMLHCFFLFAGKIWISWISINLYNLIPLAISDWPCNWRGLHTWNWCKNHFRWHWLWLCLVCPKDPKSIQLNGEEEDTTHRIPPATWQAFVALLEVPYFSGPECGNRILYVVSTFE